MHLNYQSRGRLYLAVFLATIALVLVGTATPASASGELDRWAAAEQKFSETTFTVLQEYPEDIIDFTWDEKYGTLLVQPGSLGRTNALVQDLGARIQVTEAGEQGIPYLERSSAELDAIRSLKESADLDILGARYDPATNRVEVSVSTKVDGEAQARSEVERVRRSTAFTSTYTGAELSFEYSAADYDSLEAGPTRGGLNYSDGVTGCTGGFIATRGAEYGIITAHHCHQTPVSYDSDGTDGSVGATGSTDLRFTPLFGGEATNQFQVSSNGTMRVVTSLGVLSNGLSVEKYGRASGHTSTTIREHAGCRTFFHTHFGEIHYCGLWVTNEVVSAAGDSGGPWFRDNTGLGFHSGSSPELGGSLITPMGRVAVYIPGVPQIRL